MPDEPLTTDALEAMPQRVIELCLAAGWPVTWDGLGCYAHLELSEFIEAIRGKGDVLKEAADVTLTLMALYSKAGLKVSQVFRKLNEVMAEEEEAARQQQIESAQASRPKFHFCNGKVKPYSALFCSLHAGLRTDLDFDAAGVLGVYHEALVTAIADLSNNDDPKSVMADLKRIL